MSVNVSRLVEPFVTSVVVGKDVVPRVSVINLGRLIDQMVRSADGRGRWIAIFCVLMMSSLRGERCVKPRVKGLGFTVVIYALRCNCGNCHFWQCCECRVASAYDRTGSMHCLNCQPPLPAAQ
jgi:hypothetical protein